MLDAVQIAARLRELSPAHPGAGLAELACHVLALAVQDRRQDTLRAEIDQLGEAIARMRHEIATLSAADISATQIPRATDELDAIATHTATATDTILECCEAIDALAAALPDAASHTAQGLTTRIYEACSFHDITGQRIARIVATLHTIEAGVGDLHAAFGRTRAPRPASVAPGLLNGPQLPAAAMAQADIDRLLAAS